MGKWNVWAKWYEFFSTHPLISKRLEAISAKCPDYGQPAYIVFDEKPEESYVDDFLLELLLIYAPTILVIVGIVLGIVWGITENDLFLNIILFIPSVMIFFSLIKFMRTHKCGNFQKKKVVDLLSEIKVSGVTAVPCIIEGEVIGKGDPGSIFDEDFVLKDETGIVFVDSKRVLKIMDLFVGAHEARTLFGKKVTIKGWYRRSPVPYVQIYEMTVEGAKTKRFHSYGISKFFLTLFLIIMILIAVAMVI